MIQNPLKKIRNSVWAGLGIGVLVPGLLLCLVWYLMHKFLFFAKADLLLIAAIAVNAWLMHNFFNQEKDKVARGVISATFLWAFLFFFYKINQS